MEEKHGVECWRRFCIACTGNISLDVLRVMNDSIDCVSKVSGGSARSFINEMRVQATVQRYTSST